MTTIHDVVAAIRDSHPASCDAQANIVAHCGVTTEWAVVRDSGLDVTQDQIDRASLALRGLNAQARAWNWGNVENKLERAYKALGGEHEHTGYAYHRGEHPVQAND